MRIIALDMGDKWVGIAIADPLGISCKPYQTVERTGLLVALKKIIVSERIGTIVIGRPVTMSGGASAQTEQVTKEAAVLEKKCVGIVSHDLTWVLWDERLSSKRVDTLRHTQGERAAKKMTPEEKQKSHAVAAAFILQTYLDYKAMSS